MSKNSKVVVIVVLFLAVAVGGFVWYKKNARLGAEEGLRKGRKAIEERDWKQTDAIAIRLESEGHKDYAHLLRGEKYFAQRKFQPALDELDKLSANHKFDQHTNLTIGKSCLEMRNLYLAETFFRAVLSENPENVQAHLGMAAVYYDTRAWRMVLIHLNEAVKLDPSHAVAHSRLGFLYKEMGESENATKSFKRALELGLDDKAREDNQLQLAEVLLLSGNSKGAEDALNSLRSELASSPAAIVARAECWRIKGKQEEALEILENATKDYPNSFVILLAWGKELNAAKRFEKAIPPLLKAREFRMGDQTCLRELGVAYRNTGKQREAEECESEFLRIDDKLKTAQDLVDKAIHTPNDAEVRRKLAQVWREMGRQDMVDLWENAALAVERSQGNRK